ncbi:MAG: S41 family peptidase [bacterium]
MKKFLSFIIFSLTLAMMLFFLFLKINANNLKEKDIEVDIGSTSFELFRQIVAYTYRDFADNFEIKDKLNETLKKIYNTLNYVGFKTKLYVINSNTIKQQMNDFENFYSKIFNEVTGNHIDVDKALVSKNLNKNQVELYKNFYNTVRSEKGFLKFVINSYTSTLDRYTEYMGPKEYKTFRESIQGGNFSGVGIVMFRNNREEGEIDVVEIIDDSPAEKAGIKPGDKIIKVDDKDVRDISLDVVQSMIRGPENTNVKLTIKRDNKTLEFNLIRKVIHIKSVKVINKDGIMVFRIKSFNLGVSKEFLNYYRSNGEPSSFIIDLRNNGGGLLDEAIDILAYFVGSNKMGVKLIRKNEGEQTFYTKQSKQINYSKIVILVNGYTASASEILAQSLKDYLGDSAIIIGSKTTGKNSVQTLYNLLDNGVLKLTIGRYFTFSKRDINKDKVYLDYEIDVNDFDQFKFYTEEDKKYKRALEILK